MDWLLASVVQFDVVIGCRVGYNDNMTESTKQPKPKRRWLRFSLRSFLIFLTILGIWLGWFLYRVERQREAAKWVEQNHARVEFEFEFDQNDRRLKDSQPPVRQWLLDILDIHYFSNVVRVNGVRPDVGDLSPLTKLIHLKRLTIDTRLVDEDLQHLSNLKSLEYLTFASPEQISNLTPLAKLKNLKYLWLENSQVTDLTPLAGLTKLEKLKITNAPFSDLTPLTGLTTLEELDVEGGNYNDLKPLVGLTRLRKLNISETSISDLTLLAGFANLEILNLESNEVYDLWPLMRLTKLRHLCLTNTKVTDLAPLAGLKNLKNLWLNHTQVSDEEIEKLKLALPNCNIIRKD